MKGAGGTEGGLGLFFGGLAMVIAGGYLFMQRVTVSSGFWEYGGRSAFGLTLLPLLVGIGMLFFNGKSVIGRLLTGGGLLVIVVGIIANLRVYFGPASLYDTLLILGLLAGGIGLVARSLRPPKAADR
jgi:multisubunit Na+/H+ antiporter MnhF subunit